MLESHKRVAVYGRPFSILRQFNSRVISGRSSEQIFLLRFLLSQFHLAMLLLVSVDAELEHCGDKILDRHPLPQCNLTNDVILMSVAILVNSTRLRRHTLSLGSASGSITRECSRIFCRNRIRLMVLACLLLASRYPAFSLRSP